MLSVNSSYVLYDTVSICLGQSYTFPDGSSSSLSGDNISQLNTTENCDSTIYTNLIVDGQEANVTISGAILFCQNNAVDYQWYDCEAGAIIDGETLQHYEPTVSGNFAVIINDNGCVDTSECVAMLVSSMNELEATHFDVVPNPFQEEFMISFNGSSRDYQIRVFDLLGREMKLEQINGSDNTVIKMDNANTGVYIVEVSDHTKVVRRQKIVKE